MSKLMRLCGGLVFAASLLPLAAVAQQPPGGISALLDGSALTTQDMSDQHARGLGTGGDGSIVGNINLSGGGGAITNKDSINNNAGITTIFQNTGNNSLFQNQTTVNVTLH